MKDDQELMIKFVKIVEKHPEIYDSNSDAYRTRYVEVAWDMVADSVKSELHEQCTVEELKRKWKGIRSSFSRYKRSNYETPCRKYYLYDSLRFLEPFVKPKMPTPGHEKQTEIEDSSSECNSLEEIWEESDIKPDITNEKDKHHESDILENDFSRERHSIDFRKTKKRKYEDRVPDHENEDLQFFKSILPDIKDFSIKEKRKLKMGVLQLIDDLENERKQQVV